MDPISMIVTAVALGASAGLRDTASRLIKDAYAGLKRLISEGYDQVDISPVEAKPESSAKRESLAEDLADAGAETDAELLRAASEVIAQVREHAPETEHAIGVDLQDIEAMTLRVQAIDSEGTGVRVQRGTFHGDIEIAQVRARKDSPGHPS